jgi:hypothetical protein
MLHDARPPTAAAPAGLKLVLQQVLEDDHKIAFDGFLLPDALVLDLPDQVCDIETLEIPSPQKPGLFLDPRAEVALVERSTFLGHWIRACHLGSPCSPRR